MGTPFITEDHMPEFNDTDEPALSPEEISAPEVEAVDEPEFVVEKKPRGRPPKKSELVNEVGSSGPSVVASMVDVKAEQAKLAAELVAQKAFSKAQPILETWDVTTGRKIVRYTRTHNGNVFKEFVGYVVGKKKKA